MQSAGMGYGLGPLGANILNTEPRLRKSASYRSNNSYNSNNTNSSHERRLSSQSNTGRNSRSIHKKLDLIALEITTSMTPPVSDLLPLTLRLQMALDCCSGLSYLHSKGIMHCDVKSLNFLVTSDLVVKLADLGEARLILNRPTVPIPSTGSSENSSESKSQEYNIRGHLRVPIGDEEMAMSPQNADMPLPKYVDFVDFILLFCISYFQYVTY